jgi:hypothetical protein
MPGISKDQSPNRAGWLALAATGLLLGPFPALAQTRAESTSMVASERVDLEIIQRIREEGLERSQMDAMARYANDVLGPRLTASPGARRANKWAADKMKAWGLENVVIEPWGEFGRGWERVSFSGRILTPFVQPLQAQPAGWTGSTDGTVTGPVVLVKADSIADLEAYRGKLANAWIVMDSPRDVEPEFDQPDRRFEPEVILDPPAPSAGQGEFSEERRAQRMARYMRMREMAAARAEFMREEGAAGILSPSSRNYGILRSTSNRAGMDPTQPEPLPQLVVAMEQYSQIYRNLEHDVRVQVEVNVQNRFFSEDLNAYNVLGEIPGGDKAEEYVMIGGHWDSWYMGTGATDNAAGSLVMMEAMRILRAIGVEPRRTIRIALWSGEEQGLLGSRNWVENHPELHDRISAYLNVDNGTGKLRGVYSQSNKAAIPIFEQILWPFKDLGVVGVWDRNTGGTDHLSFDGAGIPGFNFVQDPIEYGTRTHHTFVDTYDHLLIDDLMQAAVVVAATAYQLAMRDEMMPRKVQELVP